jgi:hypothetical protein
VRRTLAFGAAWLAAALVAAGVAWAGIGVVGDQVTNDRPPPLSDDQIAANLDSTASSGSTTTTAPPASSGGSTTTTAPSTTTTVAGETRTFNVTGGSVALRFAPSGVTVAYASPAPGFAQDIEPEHGNGLRVRFRSDSHESRVSGWWDGGPQFEVREDDDSGGGGGDDSGPG